MCLGPVLSMHTVLDQERQTPSPSFKCYLTINGPQNQVASSGAQGLGISARRARSRSCRLRFRLSSASCAAKTV